MSLFRSEEMTLCQLFLQSEAAYACVSELGELGLVQFRDLNPDINAFQRKFVNEVRRCDEMERKLRFLEKEIKKDGIPMLDTGDNPDAPAPREMIDLEATFEKLENEMKEVNANAEALKRNFLELTELKHILRKTQGFFEEDDEGWHSIVEGAQQALGFTSMEQILPSTSTPGSAVMQLGFVAGVILRERIPAFERMLWRACRGNVFLKQAEIDTPLEDPVTGDQVFKSVFIIFFQGDQLKSRVKKICEGFRATLYPCPETPAERREMAIGVMTRIEDLNTVLGQTQDHRHRVLVAAAKNIKVWFIKVRKIKAIYHTLNMFNLDVTQKCLIAEAWCPVLELDRIQLALRRGTERSGSSVPSILNRMHSKEQPPTYHRGNKVVTAFQAIIDAYGVNNYREMNPAVFTVITFPFLFSVMFGDAGHGLLVFLFALWMVIREKQLQANKSTDEIWNTFFGGRYIILLMGAFSIYSGLIYNDVFSKSFNIFGSSWQVNLVHGNASDIFHDELMDFPVNGSWRKSVYPLGLDPIWMISTNKITYTNSFKMKLSIILGIAQMLFGVILSFFNHRYFKQPMNIFFEFIPQVIFLMCLFGYLVILIFAKWISFNAIDDDVHCAPSLLIGLINMFMMQYNAEGEECSPQKTWYKGQQEFQTLLVVLAVLCVPVMLLVKPIVAYRKQKQKAGKREIDALPNGGSEVTHHDDDQAPIVPESEEEEAVTQGSLSVNSGDIMGEQEVVHHDETPTTDHGESTEDLGFGELLIHQAIHTIEYCLGTISHTASYLRLWALSLAHAQLSEVLWNMVMRIGLGMKGIVGAFVLVGVFAFWAVTTIGILLLMEGLSAFLHTLRLHWVEFQSKFYVGQGHEFQAFSFAHIMEMQSDE